MTTKKQPGRPTKLTLELQNNLLKYVAIGVPLDSACKCVSLDYATVREWLQRGRGEHPTRGKTPQFEAFADKYNVSIGQCEARLVAKIQSAADSDWKAAAWLLARRHPDRWAEPKPTSLDDLTVQMAQSGLLTPEQISQLIELSEATNQQVKTILNGENISDYYQ